MTFELKKKELEIKRVELAKEEMEFRIMDFQEQIKRLKDNILIQDKKINELKEERNALKGE